jgi:2-isopropylmalate synthase
MRPEDVGVPRTTLVLGKHSGRHAVQKRCEDLGLTLTRFEVDRVYRQMIALADRQKSVSDADLAQIVEEVRTGEAAARRPALSIVPPPMPHSPVKPRPSRPSREVRIPAAEYGYGHGV